MEQVQRTKVVTNPVATPLKNLLTLLQELRSELVAAREREQERIQTVVENIRRTTDG